MTSVTFRYCLKTISHIIILSSRHESDIPSLPGRQFHHLSLGASPPNRGNRISCVQNSRKTENRNSVNNSGIGILCSKNSNGRLAFPAIAGLLVLPTKQQLRDLEELDSSGNNTDPAMIIRSVIRIRH